MKKILSLLFGALLFLSCSDKKVDENSISKNDSATKESKFEMYKMSELAMLMEQMYSYNLQLRTRILDNDSLGDYPIRFDKIYAATMTDPSDNDAFFQQHAKLYIDAQKAIYAEPSQAKERFNEMVESCLACHKKKCGGPIPRIKKLFIK